MLLVGCSLLVGGWRCFSSPLPPLPGGLVNIPGEFLSEKKRRQKTSNKKEKKREPNHPGELNKAPSEHRLSISRFLEEN